jgi:hypothetical protein
MRCRALRKLTRLIILAWQSWKNICGSTPGDDRLRNADGPRFAAEG